MPCLNSTAYCTLCQVVTTTFKVLDGHLKGKKHIKNVEDKEKSTKSKINSTDFIITDPTQLPYYCAVCEHSCVSQNELEKHLAGKKHKTKAKSEKKKALENEFPKVVTLFREGFENDTKNPTEMPYFCALCQVSCTSEKAWGSHLNGT